MIFNVSVGDKEHLRKESVMKPVGHERCVFNETFGDVLLFLNSNEFAPALFGPPWPKPSIMELPGLKL